MIVLYLTNRHFSFVCRKITSSKNDRFFFSQEKYYEIEISKKEKEGEFYLKIRMIVDWTQCDKPRYQPPSELFIRLGSGVSEGAIIRRKFFRDRIESRAWTIMASIRIPWQFDNSRAFVHIFDLFASICSCRCYYTATSERSWTLVLLPSRNLLDHLDTQHLFIYWFLTRRGNQH